MDKIEKFLRKLDKKERVRIASAIHDILDGRADELDTKKLRGFGNVYRARVGDIRIIFHSDNEKIRIIGISQRDEKTYRDF